MLLSSIQCPYNQLIVWHRRALDCFGGLAIFLTKPFYTLGDRSGSKMTSSKRPLAEGDVFEVDLPMRWADADMLCHMNNAVYFRMMEEARIKMLAAAGQRSNEQMGKVVAHCSCDFLKPIVYPAQVRVRLIVEKIGRSSLSQINELYVVDDLAFGPYARGKTVLVNIDPATSRACPWTPADLQDLGATCRPGPA